MTQTMERTRHPRPRVSLPPFPRFLRPVWAEIDLGAFRRNILAFRKLLPPEKKILFVCKANAYGHGAVPLARAAEAAGIEWMGVSSVEEGAVLREAGLKLPILVLGSLFPFESLREAARYDLTPTVASTDAARALIAAGRAAGRRIPCHVKIETGMGRIGVRPSEALKVLEVLSSAPESVVLEGLYTHLACAGNARFTRQQNRRFTEVVEAAEARGIRIPLKHMANTVAARKFPETHWDMVRPGLALYGLFPGFEPVMSLKARVVFLKRVPKGTPLSYDATYKTRRETRVATFPLGYADGVSRRLSNRGHVLLHGRECPVVGRVTMDMLMADVTGAGEVHVGDEGVVFGRQGAGTASAVEIADLIGAIPYEVVCAVSARVPRVYVE